MCSTNSSPLLNQGHTLFGHVSNSLEQNLAKLGMLAVKCHLDQAPVPANNHTAIVTGELQTAKGSFSCIGTATPSMVDGLTSPQQLVDMASVQALARAARLASFSQGTTSSGGIISPTHSAVVAVTYTAREGKVKHCSRPGSITSGQTRLLRNMAKERNTTPEQYAQDICGTTLEELSSADANTIIETVKKDKRGR